MTTAVRLQARQIIGLRTRPARRLDDFVCQRSRLARPHGWRRSMGHVVVHRAQEDIVGQHAWYAADRSAERQLRPIKHVTEDAAIWLRPQFHQVANASRSARAFGRRPKWYVTKSSTARATFGVCDESLVRYPQTVLVLGRADGRRHLAVFVMHRASGIYKR